MGKIDEDEEPDAATKTIVAIVIVVLVVAVFYVTSDWEEGKQELVRLGALGVGFIFALVTFFDDWGSRIY